MNDKIINKLGKIKAHMESAKAIGSEAEAQHFASMLHQMLIKHKLEMTDIEYDAEVKDEPVDRYRMETIWRDGKPATLSLDFKNCDEVVSWFALNTQMVSRVRSLLKQKAAAGN